MLHPLRPQTQRHAGYSLVSTKRKLIAVVDDDPTLLKAIKRLLGAHGFEVELFASAEAFLAGRCGEQRACLILDIHLRGMTGIELRRHLMATGCRLPVIFITAVTDDATHREAMDAGCVACLRKPFSASLLLGAINEATA